MDKRTFIKITFLLLLVSRLSFSQNEKLVKIMSFNIYHGETLNGNFDLNTIVDVINNEKPDLVALQEVDYKTNRVNYMNIADSLAKKTKMFSTFGKAMDYDSGAYGVAILTKNKIIDLQNTNLPHGNHEPRTALEVTYILSFGDTISFISTHLDHKQKNHYRISQVNAINNMFKKNSFPTILAGDFNDIPESKTIELLEKYWTSTFDKNNPKSTYPSIEPNKKIDYIMYFPKNKWKTISNKVIQDSVASDHRAYVATLKLIR